MASPYDEHAEWYDSVVRSGTIVQDAAMNALQNLAGDVAGQKICDLGSGQGILARAFADRGARVVGVDTSVKLLSIARAEEATHARGIEYLEMDAANLAAIPAESFDAVFSNLALMDIHDLAGTAKSVHHVLKPGGWFAFTVMHPCFQTPDSHWITDDVATGRLVRGYFVEQYWSSDRGTGMRTRVGAIHRTISTYLNTLLAADLALEVIAEPRLPRESGKLEPAYDVVPAILAARFLKRRPGAS